MSCLSGTVQSAAAHIYICTRVTHNTVSLCAGLMYNLLMHALLWHCTVASYSSFCYAMYCQLKACSYVTLYTVQPANMHAVVRLCDVLHRCVRHSTGTVCCGTYPVKLISVLQERWRMETVDFVSINPRAKTTPWWRIIPNSLLLDVILADYPLVVSKIFQNCSLVPAQTIPATRWITHCLLTLA